MRPAIQILSHNRCRILHLTDDRAKLLDDALSYTEEGAFFTGRTRAHGGRWDGKKHLFYKSSRTFQRGLLPRVEQFFADNSWKYRVHDLRKNLLPAPKLSLLKPGMLKTVKMSGEYSFQLDSARKALQKGGGISWLATNAGKTTVISAIIKVLRDYVTLVVVPAKKRLAKQIRRDLAKFFGTTEENIGFIGDGIFQPRHITVALVSSLQIRKSRKKSTATRFYQRNKLIQKYLKMVQVVFYDECHHLKAKGHQKVARVIKAQFVFGMSGTPFTGKPDDLVVEAFCGPVISRIRNKDLIKLGVSAEPEVEFITIDEPKLDPTLSWDEVYKAGIVQNIYRNRRIVEEVEKDVKKGLSSLIMVREKWHGENLSTQLKERRIPHKFVYSTGFPGGAEAIDHFIELYDAGKLPVLIVTVGLFDEGQNVHNIQVLTIGDGYKGVRLLLQKIGRALRKKKRGKNRVKIRDMADLTHKWLADHSLERYEHFEREGFKIINSASSHASTTGKQKTRVYTQAFMGTWLVFGGV